ncbi:efflux RND transporter periplasmic adaptor subunit [Vibrio sp. JC009]|uniref:efflux RND transporter periplasmic adaptor subunit n=1 Tax=Vibrio sp. JC009 TaxID=2912314 RepID=UPI0023AF7ED4|nr:efflux RND transporter periplasmic adaptor subunit [Vibrio sp. JC009]WED23285.1 efflux RND transporter periplasmic adaptor subunit [Vibrio sp. JC009]
MNWKKICVSALAVMTIPAAVFYTDYAISNQPEAVAVKEALILPRVTTEHLIAGENNSVIEAFGEVISSETLSLLSQVSGRVVWKSDNFRKGKLIKKGELLLRIEDSEYQANLANAEKSLADADLALQQEKRKYKRAQDNWKRAEIADEPSKLALRKPQLAVAQTQYTAAKKAVGNAKKKLANTKIYAPFNAVIASRSVTKDSYIATGSVIGELKSADTAEIKVALAENEWQQLPASLENLQVEISSSNNRQHVWTGRVSDLSLVIDQSTRTRTLTVEVNKPLEQETPLLFGGFVNVRLQGKTLPDSFVILSSSITADNYIWFEKDNQLFRHKANKLFANSKEVGIARDGLDSKINLVKKPMSHYIEGMSVVAFEESAYAR